MKEFRDYLKENKMNDKEQLEMVKKDGYAIKHIKNPSKELQLAAIKQDPYAIQFIDNPSEKVKNYVK